MKTFYRRNLPHIQPSGYCFFVTGRLHNSIPYSTLKEIKGNYLESLSKNDLKKSLHQQNYEKLRLKKQYLFDVDTALHKIQKGPHYLSDVKVASLLKDQFHRFDGKFYELIAYSIMSNHFHLLIDTGNQVVCEETDNKQLHQILKRIKGASASYANKFLNRKGQFWERESYDIYIRNEKMYRNVISYILDNPVKAGLVKQWDDHSFTYVKVE